MAYVARADAAPVPPDIEPEAPKISRWSADDLGSLQLGTLCAWPALAAGRVSTANFAKGQAELALLGLDAEEG